MQKAEEGYSWRTGPHSFIKFMALVALHAGHAPNAESVIYPDVPKRRKMFICYHYFSSIVIRESWSECHVRSICHFAERQGDINPSLSSPLISP